MTTGEIILIVIACLAPLLAILLFVVGKKTDKKIDVNKNQQSTSKSTTTYEDFEVEQLKQKVYEDQLREQQRAQKQLEIDEENKRYAYRKELLKPKETESIGSDSFDRKKFDKEFEKMLFSDDEEEQIKESQSIKDEIKKLSPKMKAILFSDIIKPKN